MAARCPGAKVLGVGELVGWRLVFRGRGSGNYLTIEPAEGGRVPVAAWETGPAEERELDLYEDYPRFYDKRPASIACRMLGSGQEERVQGFLYVMHDGFPAGRPADSYMRACVDGYESFGFDPAILYAAREYSAALEEAENKNSGNAAWDS